MKPLLYPLLRMVAAFALLGCLTLAVSTRAQNEIPLVRIEDAPLLDTIRTLAQLDDLNFCIDPVAAHALWQRKVSRTWTNTTAKQVLGDVLQQNGLVLTSNPATTVARISTPERVLKGGLDPWLAAGTNAPIPLLKLEDAPLKDVIEQFAKSAGMEVAFDFVIPATATVSLQWKNITARQALSALLSNYDLALNERSSGPHRIAIQRRTANPSR